MSSEGLNWSTIFAADSGSPLTTQLLESVTQPVPLPDLSNAPDASPDWPKEIVVTAEHIARGVRYLTNSCPIALALRDALGSWPDWISVNSVVRVAKGGQSWLLDLGAAAHAFINAFDGGLPVSPVTLPVLRVRPEQDAFPIATSIEPGSLGGTPTTSGTYALNGSLSDTTTTTPEGEFGDWKVPTLTVTLNISGTYVKVLALTD